MCRTVEDKPQMYRRVLLFVFTIIGVTSVVTQTLFIRELEQIFYGNELCLGVIFAGWLFFTGLGSIIGRTVRKNIFIELQISLSLILPIEFILVHSIKPWLNVGPGELISPLHMIVIAFTIFAPLSMLLGLLFVQGCEWWAVVTGDKVQGVSRVYILDAIGDMVGGFIFAYILIKMFSLTTLFALCILHLLVALLLCVRFSGGLRPLPMKWVPIVLLSGVSICGLSSSRQIEKFIMNRDYNIGGTAFEVVNHGRSIYGNLVVIKLGSLYSLYENGLLSFTYPVLIDAEEKVHFTMLQVKEPSHILLLGGNPEMVIEILKYPIQELHWVKLDPKVITVCERWIDFSVLHHPKVKLHWEDGRKFVRDWRQEMTFGITNPEKFDAVIIDIGEPYTSLLNRFYTLEFFKELSEILTPSGVVALEINSNPNYLSEELKEYNGTIYKTLKKVFPYIILVPGETMKLFASQEPQYLSDNPDTLCARLIVPTQYVTKYYLPYKFYRERIAYIRGILDKFNPRLLNTDSRPISYYYDIVLKGAYFSQWFRRIFVSLSKIPSWITLLTITIVFIFIGVITRPTVFGIGIIGATGIGSQLLLILSFEVLYGYIFHKIGIITGGFMLGVAFGARFAEKRGNKLSLVLCGTILYLGLLFLIIKYLTGSRLSSFVYHLFEPIFYFLPILAGTLTGGGWTLANRHLISSGESVERSAGLLNGIDLFGSCIGSFFISVFFIPIYGLNFSFLLLGLVNLVSLIFLLKVKQ